MCYKFSGCADLTIKESSQQIDTLSVIDDGKNVLVNVNDCPLELAKSTFIDIKKQYENITCLLTGYGGAGPYPQCFENLNFDEKKVAAEKKEKHFLKQSNRLYTRIETAILPTFCWNLHINWKVIQPSKFKRNSKY